MEQIYQRIEINLTVIQTLNLIEGFKKIRRKYLHWLRKEALKYKNMQESFLVQKQKKEVKAEGQIVGSSEGNVVAYQKDERYEGKEESHLVMDLQNISAISDRSISMCSQSKGNEENPSFPVQFKYISGLKNGDTHQIIQKILKQECDLEKSLQGNSFLALSNAPSKDSSEVRRATSQIRQLRKERSVFKSSRTKSKDHNMLKSSV